MLHCFIHCTFNLADGLGVANNFLAQEHLTVKEKISFVLRASSMKLVRIGLFALVLLWIAGFGLAYKTYGCMDLGWAFNIKMLWAIVLFVGSCFYQLLKANYG